MTRSQQRGSRSRLTTLFDQAFDLFWRTHETGAQIDLSALLQSMGHSQLIVTQPSLQLQRTQDNNNIDLAADATTTVELTRTYDARETLRQKDFSDLTGAELQSIKRMMASIAWQLGQRRTRRQQPGLSPCAPRCRPAGAGGHHRPGRFSGPEPARQINHV
mgnify:CR=1 FL=1